jgi:hypothetical protein
MERWEHPQPARITSFLTELLTGINDSGTVVGYSEIDNTPYATDWRAAASTTSPPVAILGAELAKTPLETLGGC